MTLARRRDGRRRCVSSASSREQSASSQEQASRTLQQLALTLQQLPFSNHTPSSPSVRRLLLCMYEPQGFCFITAFLWQQWHCYTEKRMRRRLELNYSHNNNQNMFSPFFSIFFQLGCLRRISLRCKTIPQTLKDCLLKTEKLRRPALGRLCRLRHLSCTCSYFVCVSLHLSSAMYIELYFIYSIQIDGVCVDRHTALFPIPTIIDIWRVSMQVGIEL